MLHARKNSFKRSEFLRCYLYFRHVNRSFYYTCFCSTKVGEKTDIANPDQLLVAQEFIKKHQLIVLRK